MKTDNSPEISAMASVFDEMSVQLQLMAINFAVESAQLSRNGNIPEKIFSEALNLCDSIEFTAMEISSLLKSNIGIAMDGERRKTLAKLQEMARHIEKITNLTSGCDMAFQEEDENPPNNERQKASAGGTLLSEQALCHKSLSRKTREMQNMLKQFSLNLYSGGPSIC